MKIPVAQARAGEQMQGQAELEASEVRYRRLFETAQDGILIIDADTGNIDDINPFLVTMLGYSKQDILGKKLWEIGAFRDIKATEAAFLELQTRGYIRYEDLPLETKDGRRLDVEFISNVYRVDHRRVIQCNIRDITDRKRAEWLARRSLQEKELLLKELHHRVKNNLQIITSLLQLTLIRSQNKEAIEVFKQTQKRIQAIALVHQKICDSKDLMSIDISGYVHELVDSLLSAYGVDREKIAVTVDVAKVLLGIDLAVPCGLIINELFTNCLKYAFPGDRNGAINITLQPRNEDTVEIMVNDNGIGFCAGFDLHKAESMGLALVVSTTESQLGGTVELAQEEGSQFTIRFMINRTAGAPPAPDADKKAIRVDAPGRGTS